MGQQDTLTPAVLKFQIVDLYRERFYAITTVARNYYTKILSAEADALEFLRIGPKRRPSGYPISNTDVIDVSTRGLRKA